MSNHFKSVEWLKGTNIYEVNVRQYTKEGTFKSFQKHLPRLKEMGVEVLWLMPITPISVEVRQGTLGSYYACSSYSQVNPEFGNFDDFKNLVNEIHSLGMKVMIDWVANHTGWGHEWTKLHPDWYMKDVQGNFTEENNWHDVIDLNYDVSEMRTAMIDAMKFWIKDFDIDGFRCDMAHLVPLDFWQQARTACDAEKPLLWLAECEMVEYHDVFDITYAWEWMHVTEKIVHKESTVNDIYNELHKYSQYPKDCYKMFFTANHDENSWNGTEYEKYGDAAKAFAVFTCVWNGIPLIYSGQELPNHKRLKFFDKDEIEWTDNVALNDFYKTLLALHKTSVVNDGESFNLPTNDPNVMAFVRKKDDDVLLVLLNFSSDEKIKITIEHDWIAGEFENIFSGLQYKFNSKEEFELMDYDYLVYKKIGVK